MYYFTGKIKGPLTLEKIQQLRVNESTLIWHEGLPDWERIKNLTSFKNEMNLDKDHSFPLFKRPGQTKLHDIVDLNNALRRIKFYVDYILSLFKTKGGITKMLMVSLLAYVPFLGSLFIRGWRQEIIKKITTGEELVIPKISSLTQIGYYTKEGLKILVFRAFYLVPAFVLAAIFGLDIFEIIANVLANIFLVHKGQIVIAEIRSIIVTGLTGMVLLQAVIYTLYALIFWPLFRVAQIRYAYLKDNKVFYSTTYLKSNLALLKKYRKYVFPTFAIAVLSDFLFLFSVALTTAATFGIGLFLASPFLSVITKHWPKGASYGNLGRLFYQDVVKNQTNIFFIVGDVEKYEQETFDNKSFNSTEMYWKEGMEEWRPISELHGVKIEQVVEDHKQPYPSLTYSKEKNRILTPDENKESYEYFKSQAVKAKEALNATNIGILNWILLYIAYYIPVLGNAFLRGWRLAIVRRFGEMDLIKDRDSWERYFKDGIKLYVIRWIYFLPESILFAIVGFQSVILIIDIIRWLLENFHSFNFSALVSLIISRVTVRLLLQFALIGLYSMIVWPVYRIAMIRYALEENSSARKMFLSRKSLAKCFQIYRQNPSEVLGVYFLVAGIDIYLILFSGLITLLTAGIALVIAVPFIMILGNYWFKGYAYGKLGLILEKKGAIGPSH